MKTFVIIIAIVVTAVVVWYQYDISTRETIPTEPVSVPVPVTKNLPADIATSTLPTEVSSDNTQSQTYRNDEWGISFQYPNGWEIREPAFGSAVSLFNLAVEPVENFSIKAIVINITPKDWIDKAMVKMENRGVIFKDDSVAGFEAISYESLSEGAPSTGYLVLINNAYWINIISKKEYQTELNQVLESLEITPVELAE
jgi:hypothetical protein